MSKVLILAEHDGAVLNPSTAKCVSCAGGLNAESIDVAVFSDACTPIAEQAAALMGVTRVLTVERDENAH